MQSCHQPSTCKKAASLRQWDEACLSWRSAHDQSRAAETPDVSVWPHGPWEDRAQSVPNEPHQGQRTVTARTHTGHLFQMDVFSSLPAGRPQVSQDRICLLYVTSAVSEAVHPMICAHPHSPSPLISLPTPFHLPPPLLLRRQRWESMKGPWMGSARRSSAGV